MSVFKVGKVYYYEFSVDGVKYKKSTRMSNRADALKVEKQARKEALVGALRPRKAKTLSLKEAYEKIEKSRFRRNTDGQRALRQLSRCLEIIGWKKNLNEIDHDDLVKVRNALVDQGVSNATVNRYFAPLKTLLNDARKEWGLEVSHINLRSLKEPTNSYKFITLAEEQILLEKLDEGVYKDLVVVLLDTGMRVAECVGHLSLSDFDRENRVLYVQAETTKSKVGRYIPLTSRAFNALERQVSRPDDGLKDGSLDWGVTTNWASKMLSKLLPRDVTAHGLRHTFCYRQIAKGTNLYVVQQLMGHSTIQMTERYAHADLEDLRKAIQ